MKVDSVKQFVALRATLTQEKSKLEARLAELNRALGEVSPPPSARAISNATTTPRTAPRAVNKLSLREAVAQVTRSKALTKAEILGAIRKIGYQFSAKDPMNSLNVTLYTPGNFKNNGDGTFSALKK